MLSSMLSNTAAMTDFGGTLMSGTGNRLMVMPAALAEAERSGKSPPPRPVAHCMATTSRAAHSTRRPAEQPYRAAVHSRKAHPRLGAGGRPDQINERLGADRSKPAGDLKS